MCADFHSLIRRMDARSFVPRILWYKLLDLLLGTFLEYHRSPLTSSHLREPRFGVQTAGSVFSTINMADLAPLPLSQTKEKLLKYLNLPLDTYALMDVCLASPESTTVTL